jgi:putative transposase
MSYSIDLRKRVVHHVESGGSKVEASRLFQVSLWCVNDWCSREDLSSKSPPGRPRKIDWDALEKDIQDNPDKLLRERAEEFGVWTNAIWYACQRMKITYKKNSSIPGERS